MSHNARVRSAWIVGPFVSQAEFQAFDDAQYASINGDAGGSWTPTAGITIGGAGIKVRGQGVFAGGTHACTLTTDAGGVVTLDVGSTNTFGGTTSLSADATLATNGAVTVGSGCSTTWLSSSSLAFGMNTNLALNGNVTGSPTFNAGAAWDFRSGSTLTQQSGSGITHNGGTFDSEAGSAMSFAATVTILIGASISLLGPTVVSGSAAQTGWRETAAADSDQTYDCSYDLYVVPTLTATRNYTIAHTSGVTPVEGSRVRFHHYGGGGGVLNIKREGGALICSCTGFAGFFVELEFRDAGWHAIAWNDTNTAGSFPAGG